METRVLTLWAIATLSLVQARDVIPADPQKFGLRSGNSVTPVIEEHPRCLPPMRDSTKYVFRFPSDTSTLYFLCYDKNSNIPLQSRHQLSPPVSEVTLTTPLATDKFSNNLIATPTDFYKCSSQVENLKSLLNSENQARSLIDCNTGFYYTPSNLVPASDFPFPQQSEATQYFINTFPQWKSIKEGNWKKLETSIRKYANFGNPLMVTGGTLRMATLPDNTGQEKPVHMTRNNANIPTVAVPRLVWKLVYDHRRYESIVFVTVNNPYRKNIGDLFQNDEVVCNCVCDETEGWFDGWDRTDFSKGYIYCCTWDEFNKNVGIDYLPNTNLMRKKH